MTNQEAIKNLDTMWKMLTSAHDEIADSFVVAYTMAVDALKAQTDGDTISRQVSIDAVQGIGRLATLPDNDAAVRMSAVEYVLFNLPSAQPEPSDVARSIATIIENEQDMRVVLKNAQNDIVHCRDCKFCHKSPDWKHRQSFGESIWYCEENRGFNFAQTVGLDDYCSSAERRTDEQTD